MFEHGGLSVGVGTQGFGWKRGGTRVMDIGVYYDVDGIQLADWGRKENGGPGYIHLIRRVVLAILDPLTHPAA